MKIEDMDVEIDEKEQAKVIMGGTGLFILILFGLYVWWT